MEWSAITGAKGYEVQMSTSGAQWATIALSFASTLLRKKGEPWDYIHKHCICKEYCWLKPWLPPFIPCFACSRVYQLSHSPKLVMTHARWLAALPCRRTRVENLLEYGLGIWLKWWRLWWPSSASSLSQYCLENKGRWDYVPAVAFFRLNRTIVSTTEDCTRLFSTTNNESLSIYIYI